MKRSISILALAGALLLTSAALQKRVTQGPAEFSATLASASTAWEAGDYGACIKGLRTALGLATEKRAESIRASLPAAPAGWTAVPDRKQDGGNAFAAAMASSIGSVVERRYQKDAGKGSMTVTVTADSPVVQMMTMVLANPAMLGPGSELIEYGAHKAVLKAEGQKLQLQILLNAVHICEVNAQGVTEDELFALFDQALVDRLAKVLGS